MTGNKKALRDAFAHLGEEHVGFARFWIAMFGVCGAILVVNSLRVIDASGVNTPLILIIVLGLSLFLGAAIVEWKRAELAAHSPDTLHFFVGVFSLLGFVGLLLASVSYWLWG